MLVGRGKHVCESLRIVRVSAGANSFVKVRLGPADSLRIAQHILFFLNGFLFPAFKFADDDARDD